MENAMSTSSRPTSMAIPRTSSPISKSPSLSEILNNTATPPWTLSAFTAYLSQNHCLETLEFLMEAERYRTVHNQLSTRAIRSLPEDETLCTVWQRLMQTYIMPYSPREVNVSAPVRDRLLRLHCSSSYITDPSELDEATGIVRELMGDSVLVPFLESVAPSAVVESSYDVSQEARRSRSRLRIPKDLMSSSDDASQSPKTSFLPMLGLGRSSLAASRSTSGSAFDSTDADLVTDDSSSPNSTPGHEPMTPPTTPPSSEFTFSASPNTIQRAITGSSWKKMGARLGLSRRSRSVRRSQPTSVSSAAYNGTPPIPNRHSDSGPAL
jgi:hypothetical protein